MATTLHDVLDQLTFDLEGLSRIHACFLTLRLTPLRVHVWTLLDAVHEETEDALARAEARLCASFPGVGFDFSTIHLRGRDPVQFIPDGAVPVITGHPAILAHFRAALAGPAHAKP